VLNTGCLVDIHTEADINEVVIASVFYTTQNSEKETIAIPMTILSKQSVNFTCEPQFYNSFSIPFNLFNKRFTIIGF
jgi:hypothetical protein